jgi:hypothetical protein
LFQNSLEAFRLPPNPVLSIRQDAHFLWMNSSGEIVVVENIEVPTGPNVGSGVDNPLFQSESFGTPAHTAGICNPSSALSSGHDIFGTLGTSSNQPMSSQIPKTSITYTVPLDHFTSTTSNVAIVSYQLLVGSHSILPLQMAHSTMVPQATIVSTRNVVITQAPIGTSLPLRPNPSLPPGYNALNSSIVIPAQNPSGGSRLYVPPRYNVASHFVPTPTQVLSEGGFTFLLHPCLKDLIVLVARPSTNPTPTPLVASHVVDGMIGTFHVEIQSTHTSHANPNSTASNVQNTPTPTPSSNKTFEVNSVQSTPTGKNKNKKKGKSKEDKNNNQQSEKPKTQPVYDKDKCKPRYPCLICGDNHYTKYCP